MLPKIATGSLGLEGIDRLLVARTGSRDEMALRSVDNNARSNFAGKVHKSEFLSRLDSQADPSGALYGELARVWFQVKMSSRARNKVRRS